MVNDDEWLIKALKTLKTLTLNGSTVNINRMVTNG